MLLKKFPYDVFPNIYPELLRKPHRENRNRFTLFISLNIIAVSVSAMEFLRISQIEFQFGIS
jgi:hypothetical protein